VHVKVGALIVLAFTLVSCASFIKSLSNLQVSFEQSLDQPSSSTQPAPYQPAPGAQSKPQPTQAGALAAGTRPAIVASNPSSPPIPPGWDAAVVDTTQGADYLTAIERKVVIEINLVRTNPAEYAQTFIVPMRRYFQGKILQYPGEIAIMTNEGPSALEEAIRQLESTNAVGPLSPKKGLVLAARDHANDQAKTGQTGHSGADGSDPGQRIARYGKWKATWGENIDYGNSQARRIVTALLIDDGVPSRGHRKNLLNPKFETVGVAVGPHPVYRSMCVMDFAGGYESSFNGTGG